jgi:Holliday junction resolvase-like predicted endonuclease
MRYIEFNKNFLYKSFRIKVCKELQINFRLYGKDSNFSPDYYVYGNTIFVKDSEISLFSSLAKAVTQILGIPLQEEAKIEKLLLSAEEGRLTRLLQEWGISVPEGILQDLEELPQEVNEFISHAGKPEEKNENFQSSLLPGNQDKKTSFEKSKPLLEEQEDKERKEKDDLEVVDTEFKQRFDSLKIRTESTRNCPKRPINTAVDNERSNRKKPTNTVSYRERRINSNIDSPDKTKEGKEAEDYVREELKKLLGSEWRISEKPERDENGREVDIVISHKRSGTTFFMEVKSVDRNLIFWSIKEIERAKIEEDKYFMAIVMKKDGELREIFVVKNPLETLKHLKITGTWIWNIRKDGIELDSREWKKPSNEPCEKPTNFSFKIEGITREFLEVNGNIFSLEEFVREVENQRQN